MKKKNLLIKIILLVIILICITMAIIIFLKKDDIRLNDNIGNVIVNEESSNETTIEEKITYVTEQEEFYRISQTINNYYDTINKSKYYLSDGTNMANDDDVKSSIFDLLSKEYIEENHISIENIYNYVDDIKNNMRFIALKIKKLESFGVNKYIVYGDLINMEEEADPKLIYIFVNVDFQNETFSIEPTNGEYRNIDEIDYTINLEKIEPNEYNEYTKLNMLSEDILKEKFNDLKIMILNDNKYVYDNLLNEEYKEKRFETYEKYQTFLNENKQRFLEMTLAKYQMNEYDKYTEYVFLDKKDNYYIFEQKTASDFNVILDTYTINLPGFTEKYNKGNEQVKVGMNIEKVISALNNKDYNYIYEKLDETFKNNNFNTIEKFENYIDNNFFNTNKVEYEKFSEEGTAYIYELKVKESDDDNANSKNFTIIMKLLENNNFVMSFSIN